MPYPGIPAGSEQEKKIDRCVTAVMATGRDKSAAIAICRSAIVKETLRASDETAIDQANYRPAGPASTQICGDCRFGANPTNHCQKFDFTYDPEYTCDQWLPDIAASRERLASLAAANKSRLAARDEWVAAARKRLGLKTGKETPMNNNTRLKREISSAVRDELANSDFVFPETRSFPIRQPADVEAAVRAWGRASAVRDSGFTFEDFQRRLTRIARRKGPSFMEKLPAAWQVDEKGTSGVDGGGYAHGPGGLFSVAGLGKKKKATGPGSPLGNYLRQRRQAKGWSLPRLANVVGCSPSALGQIERGEITTPSDRLLLALARALIIPKNDLDSLLAAKSLRPGLIVFKDSNGRYRWVMVSSSAYRDRDGEIVSTQALKQAVAQLDASGEHGPLLWWHTPIKIGQTDFGMVYGRMLVESGNFINERVGEIAAQKAAKLGGSIGFKHPAYEPGPDGTFNIISIFERSLLPVEKAANIFTSLFTVKETVMNTDKIKEFINLVGPAEAAKLLGDISATDKSAQQAGFVYKSQRDLENMTGDELLEYSLLLKEHEAAQAEAEAEATKAAQTGSESRALLERMMTMMEAHDQAIKSLTATTPPASSPPVAQKGATEKAAGEGEAMMAEGEALAEEGQTMVEEGDVAELLKRIMGMLEKHDQAIAALTGMIEASQKNARQSTETLDQRLRSLEGTQPRASQNGYRASQQAPTITDTKETETTDPETAIVEAVKSARPEVAPFAQAANAFAKSLPSHPYWGVAPTDGLNK